MLNIITTNKELTRYKAKAHREAIIITRHNQDDRALISADEYKRLRQLDQKAVYVHELPDEIINELGTVPIPEESHRLDDEHQYT